MLTAPLESSLIRMDEELKEEALNIFTLVRVAFTCYWETPVSETFKVNVTSGNQTQRNKHPVA